jgi:hypothetical protein
MDVEFGIIITIAAFALFYVRLAILRRKKRRELREMQLAVKRKGRGAKMTMPEENRPGYEITSWALVAVAGLVILLGMVARQNASVPTWAHEYWWVGTTLGVLLFAFCFK